MRALLVVFVLCLIALIFTMMAFRMHIRKHPPQPGDPPPLPAPPNEAPLQPSQLETPKVPEK